MVGSSCGCDGGSVGYVRMWHWGIYCHTPTEKFLIAIVIVAVSNGTAAATVSTATAIAGVVVGPLSMVQKF